MIFNKTDCRYCRRRINKSYRYCPLCGYDQKKPVQEYPLMPSISFPFSKIFDELTKEFSREFDKLYEEDFEKKSRKVKSSGISISISTEGGEPRIRMHTLGDAEREQRVQAKQIKQRVLSKEEAERYAKLPRHEAETTVKRLGDKIIYEISLPGVSRVEDVFVTKLQNSIEIKAFGKDKAYFKLIPVDLHIGNYLLKEGKLVLELRE